MRARILAIIALSASAVLQVINLSENSEERSILRNRVIQLQNENGFLRDHLGIGRDELLTIERWKERDIERVRACR